MARTGRSGIGTTATGAFSGLAHSVAGGA